MYLIMNDASIAQKVREAGFCVIQTNHGANPQFLVLYSDELLAFVHANFSEQKFYRTDVVCF